MGIFNEHSTGLTYTRGLPVNGPPGPGFKLTSDGNYDIDGKLLKNITTGTDQEDIMSKIWIDDHVAGQTANLTYYLKKDGSISLAGNLNFNNHIGFNHGVGMQPNYLLNKSLNKSQIDTLVAFNHCDPQGREPRDEC